MFPKYHIQLLQTLLEILENKPVSSKEYLLATLSLQWCFTRAPGMRALIIKDLPRYAPFIEVSHFPLLQSEYPCARQIRAYQMALTNPPLMVKNQSNSNDNVPKNWSLVRVKNSI